MDKFLTYVQGHLLLNLIKQFFANGGVINASALTYTTLFAVVPLMTVSYAVLAMIPSFQGVGQEVQNWVFSNFVPATGEVVQNYLSDFTSQAQRLTAVGGIFLFVTSVMMMKNIESAFNRIWRVEKARKGMSSFLLYWAILSLGPILIGVGLLISSYVASLSFISEAASIVGRARLLSLLPIVMSIMAFTLLYAAVPNCRVPFKSALVAAVVVALLFEIAKRAFALFAVQFPSYELIYGAFAAVPLFLAWIFITWVIILLGAELSRLLTVRNHHSSVGFVSHLEAVLSVLHQLWKAQQQGKSLADDALLSSVAGLNQQRWDEYQYLLMDAKIICRTEQGEYLLSRDLNELTLYQLTQLMPWPLPLVSNDATLVHWQGRLHQQLATLHRQNADLLAMPLTELYSVEVATVSIEK